MTCYCVSTENQYLITEEVAGVSAEVCLSAINGLMSTSYLLHWQAGEIKAFPALPFWLCAELYWECSHNEEQLKEPVPWGPTKV